MANEVTVTASLSCNKPSVMSSAVGRAITNAQFTMTGNFYVAPESMSVGTSATVIPLGQITAPHWAYFKNLDPTNYLTIRNGSGGADLCQLYPGEFAIIPLLTTCVPYAVANNAPVLMEFMILSY